MKVAMLIDRNPNLYCWIEGHTDLFGGDEFNLELLGHPLLHQCHEGQDVTGGRSAAVDDEVGVLGTHLRTAHAVLLETELVENGLARLPDVGLALGVHFQHAVVPLDDLHAGRYVGRFKRNVEDVVDRHAGRDFDEQARLADLGQVALRNRRLERRELRLQRIKKNVGSQINH